jgi:hypothetical protein
MVELPTATAVINPFVDVLTVATFAFDEYQFTEEVRFWVLPSL